ncbi:aminotransferase class V-fold PLP-dependent enzyme [Alteromonadaceae bacterium M269]|nr:aminotransferase class V-fold PLP-dependent enzyme [Alteromonadaceae bacterium M269]
MSQNDSFRHLYDMPEKGTYFLSHSVGLLPKSAEKALKQQFFQAWRNGDDQIWPHWLNAVDHFRQALAKLLNADSHAFCPQMNVSSGLTKVIGSLPMHQSKNTLLISENDFPSTSFVIKQAKRLGYEIKVIPKGRDHQNLETWTEFLTPEVAAVFITHVHYNTNQLIPVAQISALARTIDCMTIVDVAQSIGIVPIDLQSWHVDVVVGSCIKWLCGGPGAGFMWVNPCVNNQLEPLDVGWFSHDNPFEFDPNNFEYANDSSRFWGGTPSIAPFVIATNSIEQQLQIGIEKIRLNNKVLCQKLMSAVDRKFVVSPTDLDKKGGTLVLKFDEQDKVIEKLNAMNMMFDARELGLRVSPHIYNDDDDIDRLIQCLP